MRFNEIGWVTWVTCFLWDWFHVMNDWELPKCTSDNCCCWYFDSGCRHSYSRSACFRTLRVSTRMLYWRISLIGLISDSCRAMKCSIRMMLLARWCSRISRYNHPFSLFLSFRWCLWYFYSSPFKACFFFESSEKHVEHVLIILCFVLIISQRKGCPLMGLPSYPTLDSQRERLSRLGYNRNEVYNMLDIYNKFTD